MYNYANSHSWHTSAKCGVLLVSSVVPGLDKVGRLYQRHAVSKTCHIQAYLKKMRRTRQASRRCHGGLTCFTCLETYLCLPCRYQGLVKNQSKFQVFDGVS
mmetsp:Transcript_62188/g.52709  ORF Transcript_62188/g.52709 Transcript_62188/m.52709 type:complete len:101 (-) Transcript_62188:528-830(-)